MEARRCGTIRIDHPAADKSLRARRALFCARRQSPRFGRKSARHRIHRRGDRFTAERNKIKARLYAEIDDKRNHLV